MNVWDEEGNESGFSAPAWFETGRYDCPWQVEWIGGEAESPQLRKGFRAEKAIRRARAYARGAGLYRLFINGQNAGDDLLTPHFNVYDQWMQYQTWDVTALLRQGDNVVGAWLGNGHAKVMLPDSECMQVMLNGQPAAPTATEDGCRVYECGSGQ